VESKQTTTQGSSATLFKADDRLRTTTNDKLKLDIRNANALLYVEPSHYKIDGTHRAVLQVPQPARTRGERSPNARRKWWITVVALFRPNLSEDRRQGESRTRPSGRMRGIAKLRVDISKTEEDIHALCLKNVNLDRCENYSGLD